MRESIFCFIQGINDYVQIYTYSIYIVRIDIFINLASNILLLTSKKCFLTSQGLVGAGANCRALIIHLNLLQIPDPMDFVKPFRKFERNG